MAWWINNLNRKKDFWLDMHPTNWNDENPVLSLDGSYNNFNVQSLKQHQTSVRKQGYEFPYNDQIEADQTKASPWNLAW